MNAFVSRLPWDHAVLLSATPRNAAAISCALPVSPFAADGLLFSLKFRTCPCLFGAYQQPNHHVAQFPDLVSTFGGHAFDAYWR